MSTFWLLCQAICCRYEYGRWEKRMNSCVYTTVMRPSAWCLKAFLLHPSATATVSEKLATIANWRGETHCCTIQLPNAESSFYLNGCTKGTNWCKMASELTWEALNFAHFLCSVCVCVRVGGGGVLTHRSYNTLPWPDHSKFRWLQPFLI